MRMLVADLKYAFRTLAKSPGFTFIATLSLALGIGANASMFSFVDALLLRPLPVRDAGSVVAIHSSAPGARLDDMSYPDYADLRDGVHVLSSAVCYKAFPVGVSASRESVAQMTLGYMVSGNFFSGLGLEIPLGRAFRPDEDRTPGKDLVAVISYTMWEQHFASDPNIAGRKVRLNGSEFTVIGIAPRDFMGPEPFVHAALFVPMNAYPQAVPGAGADYLTARRSHNLNVLARLKPGASARSAQAELIAAAGRLAAQYPESNRDRTAVVLTYLQDRYERDTVDGILSITLMGITGIVLLIACANVANLVMARGAARVKEIAIRMAIGASRFALIRQMLTESMLLALLGGIAGVAVGWAGVTFLGSVHIPSNYPIELGVRMDTRLLVFSLLLATATGVLFGLLPALRGTRSDLGATIKSSDQGPSRTGFWRRRVAGRNVLVTAQLALSVVLLIAAGLFVRGFTAAQRMDPGFRIDHTLLVAFDPSLVRYDQEKSRQFYRTLVDRTRTLPGVSDAALAHSVPFGGDVGTRAVIADGYQIRTGEDSPFAFSSVVDESYFSLMETRILRGRAFDVRDTAASPRVAILNETAARRFFPNRDAVGQRMRLDKADGPVVEIVGLAKDGKYLYWAEPAEPFLWTPLAQDFNAHLTLHVRTLGDPAALAPALRNEVRAIDPDMPLFDVRSLEAFYQGKAMLGPRLMLQMVGAIGLTGLLLSVIGLYGVVAYAVSRRTREIGIRMAVGARPGDVLRMVLGQGLTFTAIGVVAGLTMAFFASRILGGFMVGVSPRDPAVFLLVPPILATVMLGASWLPARRAARVDPTLALRQE